jgi:hypothetical protein
MCACWCRNPRIWKIKATGHPAVAQFKVTEVNEVLDEVFKKNVNDFQDNTRKQVKKDNGGYEWELMKDLEFENESNRNIGNK